MLNEVRNLLQRLNDGYIARNVNDLDAFVRELFVDDPNTTILGTSEGELCVGLAEVSNLLKNDWLYWNDFRIDSERAVVHPVGNAYWFGVVASIKYTFETSESTHQRLLEFVRGQLQLAEESPLEALSTLNWGLAHYLCQRSEQERTYLWPVRLTGIVCQDNGVWKFRYLQFSLPSAASPDERHGTAYLDRLYQSPRRSTEGFSQSAKQHELLAQVKSFVRQMSAGDIDAATACFAPEGLNLLITPEDDSLRTGAVRERLAALRDKLGTLLPRYEEALTFSAGGLAWVVCEGVAQRTVQAADALRQQAAELCQLVDSELPAGEKLLQTKLGIARQLKDIASGSEYRLPFRLEVAMSQEQSTWQIQALQLSHPFYWIFEDKIRSVRL